MSRKKKVVADDDMLPEYDFSGAVRGKYYERYRQGSNVVLLDPDVSDAFPSAAAVNEALRLLVSLARKRVRAGRRKPRSEKGSDALRTGASEKRGARG